MLPPMVGVPALVWCVSGPSARMTWPTRTARSHRIVGGPAAKATRSDVTTAPAERKVR